MATLRAKSDDFLVRFPSGYYLMKGGQQTKDPREALRMGMYEALESASVFRAFQDKGTSAVLAETEIMTDRILNRLCMVCEKPNPGNGDWRYCCPECDRAIHAADREANTI
jgi:hypothetical protein